MRELEALSAPPAQSAPLTSTYLPTLYGWRAIAISAVLICHGFAPADTDSLPRVQSLLAAFALRLGPQGVALFFAISGFLITSLLIHEFHQKGWVSLRSFYIRRGFRIMPPALVYLGVIGVLGLAGVLVLARGELLASAFWFNNYWPLRSWYTNHFWSLSIEEHFYMFWPVLLAAAGLRRVRWYALAIIAATAVWRPWSLAHVHWTVAPLQQTDTRLDAFLFACLLAILVNDRVNGRAVTQWLVRPSVRWATVVLLLATAAMALRSDLQATRILLQSALFPLLLAGSIYSPGDWVGRCLESKPFHFLGKISYSVYLWQMPFLTPPANMQSAALWFPVKLVAVILVAYGSYVIIEKPCMDLGRRLSRA